MVKKVKEQGIKFKDDDVLDMNWTIKSDVDLTKISEQDINAFNNRLEAKVKKL